MPPNRSNRPLNAQRARGFTLVDLFVIIVVTGLVFAVLFSLSDHVREKNYRLNCGDNLLKISIALRSYAEDNDGRLPAAMTETTRITGNRRFAQRVTWRNRLTFYFSENHPDFPVCPDRELPGIFAGRDDSPEYSGYAYNANLSQAHLWRKSQPSSAVGRQTTTAVANASAFDFPALVVEVMEARTGMVALNAPDTLTDVVGGFADNATADLVRLQSPGALRHGGGANYVFADGHSHWFVPSGISARPKCDGVHPGTGI